MTMTLRWFSCLIPLFCIIHAQEFLNFHLDQERVRCIGVQCPADRPRCVIENHLATCIAPPLSTNTNANTNRLSRAPRRPLDLPATLTLTGGTNTEYQPPSLNTPDLRDTNANKPATLSRSADSISRFRSQNQPFFSSNIPDFRNTNINQPATQGRSSDPRLQTQGQPLSPVISNRPTGISPSLSNAGGNQSPSAAASGAPRSCFQRPDPGNCFAYFPRYYYNPSSRRCENFVYGGCGGNNNRFESLLDCFRVCILPQGNANNNDGRNSNDRGSNNNNINRSNNNNDNGLGNSNSALIDKNVATLFDSNLFFSMPSLDLLSNPINAIGSVPENVKPPPSQQRSSGFAPGAPPPPPRLCSYDADPGTCLGHLPRYYFNHNSQQCESFFYGGCGGNENNFETLDDCRQTCDYFDEYVDRQNNQQTSDKPISSNVITTESNNRPLSPPYEPRGSFEGFAVGAPPPLPRTCLLSADRGPCLTPIKRYFFNPQTHRCETFAFGGCGGNQNNFATLEDCRRMCDYYDENIDRQNSGNIRTSVGSTASTSGGAMNFPASQRGVLAQDGFMCTLQPDPGPCSSYEQRYFYNSNAKRCEGFNYGGCQGNQNNFRTLTDCRMACDQFVNQRNVDLSKQIPSMMPSTTSTDRLQLPPLSRFPLTDGIGNVQNQPANNGVNYPVSASQAGRPSQCYMNSQPGPCRAYIPRYFYNRDTGACQQFIYGGCQPNQNNFQTEDECRRVCGGRPIRSSGTSRGATIDGTGIVPLQPLRGAHPTPVPFGSFRLSMDNAGTRSLTFTTPMPQTNGQGDPPYVSGNMNSVNICALPANPGTCFQQIPSFYYNMQRGNCEPFIFYGCGGNQNRFSSEQECYSMCGQDGVNNGPAASFSNSF